MSQEGSLYDLLHSERANALRNSEKFLAAVEYFKGREDIVKARMDYLKENGQDALLTEDDFQRIIEESKADMENYLIFDEESRKEKT